jgi:hypothetical protein
MEFINIKSNDSNICIADSCCKLQQLNSFQLLNLNDNNIYTKIANYFILKNGYNQRNVHVVLKYKLRKSNNTELNEALITHNSDIMKCCMETILLLNNESHVYLVNKTHNTLIQCKAQQNNCINTTDPENTYFFSRCNKSILTFTYYKNNKPNLPYFNYKCNDELTFSHVSKADFFMYDKKPIIINDNISFKEITEFFNNEIILDDTINKKNIILTISYLQETSQIFLPTDTQNILPDNLNVDNMFGLYDYYYLSLKFNTNIIEQNFQKMCKNILNNFNITCQSRPFFEKNLVFINKCNLTMEETIIENIACNIICDKLGWIYDRSKYDITISSTLFTHPRLNEYHLYTIVLNFEKDNINDFFILSDNYTKLQSNHVYFINPTNINIIGFQPNQFKEQHFKTNNYIFINIYYQITTSFYKTFTDNVKDKPYYQNTHKLNIEINKNDIKYITNHQEKHITTDNKDNFNIDTMKKIYKNYITENNVIHFFYNPNMMYLNNELIQNDNVFKINKAKINIQTHNLLTHIKENINFKKNNVIAYINKDHALFMPIFGLYNNILTKAITCLYNDKFIFNVKKCFIRKEPEQFNYVSSFCDINDNKNNNLIIFISINLQNEYDTFGDINIYTNYTNYNYTNNTKYTLEYIIEAINTNDDIMSIEEQKQLINFANKNIEIIDKIPEDDYTILSSYHDITPFTYGIKNKSWDMYKMCDIDEKIKILIESIRQRIIEKENFQIKDEKPSSLTDFFQIMRKNSYVHYHKDPNDEGTYHIRFNVIIQNADIGGISVYNGLFQKSIERQYILCRSGIDYHSSTEIGSDKPRLAISYGFNIPKSQISNHPNIFGDLIKNDI